MNALPSFLRRWTNLRWRPSRRSPSAFDAQRIAVIRQLADFWRDRSASELQARMRELRGAAGGDPVSTLASDTVDAVFALVQEAVRRCWGIEYYDVQLLAGMSLVRGEVAELATGEGKTLVQALAAAALALGGHGVHVMTSNAYLAKRDHEQVAPALRLLGLEVGLLRAGDSAPEKRQAYHADVTYGPGYEFGFDHLRDQLARRRQAAPSLGEGLRRQFRGQHPTPAPLMQRGHAVAIVDEVDSVLIDEATLPLILTVGPRAPHPQAEIYGHAATLAASLEATVHFVLDRRLRYARLTEGGVRRIMAKDHVPPPGKLCQNWPAYVEQALVARHLLCRDIDYVVDRDEVMLVDPATGRVFSDRTLTHGLQQAVEAKEQVTVTAERPPQARISRQQFFRLYGKLCGMTGTARSAEREFREIFRVAVTIIPPRVPCRRITLPPRYFADRVSKRAAILEDVRRCRSAGQPVLVGTRTIEESHRLAELFTGAALDFALLNGTQNAEEARIVAQAGAPGAVTIATNIAGRGTDIRLHPAAASAGGLHVIVSEPHTSRRVDRQLVGRSARQGDPGSCRLFASAEDELIRLHAPRLASRMCRLSDAQGEIHRDLSANIERLQRRVEAMQQLHRRRMLKYDTWLADVLTSLHPGDGSS